MCVILGLEISIRGLAEVFTPARAAACTRDPVAERIPAQAGGCILVQGVDSIPAQGVGYTLVQGAAYILAQGAGYTLVQEAVCIQVHVTIPTEATYRLGQCSLSIWSNTV